MELINIKIVFRGYNYNNTVIYVSICIHIYLVYLVYRSVSRIYIIYVNVFIYSHNGAAKGSDINVIIDYNWTSTI